MYQKNSLTTPGISSLSINVNVSLSYGRYMPQTASTKLPAIFVQLTCYRYAIEHEIHGEKIVLEHFGDGKSSRKYPKYSMSPQRLVYIPLELSPQHDCGHGPGSEPKHVDNSKLPMLARIEHILRPHQTKECHEEIQITIEHR